MNDGGNMYKRKKISKIAGTIFDIIFDSHLLETIAILLFFIINIILICIDSLATTKFFLFFMAFLFFILT